MATNRDRGVAVLGQTMGGQIDQHFAKGLNLIVDMITLAFALSLFDAKRLADPSDAID